MEARMAEMTRQALLGSAQGEWNKGNLTLCCLTQRGLYKLLLSTESQEFPSAERDCVLHVWLLKESVPVLTVWKDEIQLLAEEWLTWQEAQYQFLILKIAFLLWHFVFWMALVVHFHLLHKPLEIQEDF